MALEVDRDGNINSIISQITQKSAQKQKLKFENVRIIFGGRMLFGKELIRDTNLVQNSTVQVKIPLDGGALSVNDPIIKELCKNYRVEKLICRKCYAKLPIGARTCRKRRCGKWADLRKRRRNQYSEC